MSTATAGKQTVQSDPQWAAFLTEKVAKAVDEQPEWAVLAAHLIGIGGGGVAAVYEEDITNLLDASRTRMWTGEDAMFMKGRPSDCHANTADLHVRKGHLIATGWALSDDGCWRQHSWGIHKTSGRVIETTVGRVAYYGFILVGEDEISDFCFYNC